MDGDNPNFADELKRRGEFDYDDDDGQESSKRVRIDNDEIDSTNPFALTEVAKVVDELLEQTMSEISISSEKSDDEEVQQDADMNLAADNDEDENDELDNFINSLSGESATNNNNNLPQSNSVAEEDLVLSSSSSSPSGSDDDNEESQLVDQKASPQQQQQPEQMEIEQTSIDKATTETKEDVQPTLPIAAPIEEHSGLSIKLPGVIHLDSDTPTSSKKEANGSSGTSSSAKATANSSGSSLQSAGPSSSKYDRKAIDHLDLDSDSRDDSDHHKEDDDEDFDDDEMRLLKSMAGDGDDSGGEDGVNNQDLEFKLSCGLGMFSASDKVIVTDRDPKTLSKYEQERLKEKLQEEERERMQ